MAELVLQVTKWAHDILPQTFITISQKKISALLQCTNIIERANELHR